MTLLTDLVFVARAFTLPLDNIVHGLFLRLQYPQQKGQTIQLLR